MQTPQLGEAITDLKLMNEQINVHRKEITEKDNTCMKKNDQTKEDVTKLKGGFVNAEVKHGNEMNVIRQGKQICVSMQELRKGFKYFWYKTKSLTK